MSSHHRAREAFSHRAERRQGCSVHQRKVCDLVVKKVGCVQLLVQLVVECSVSATEKRDPLAALRARKAAGTLGGNVIPPAADPTTEQIEKRDPLAALRARKAAAARTATSEAEETNEGMVTL